MSPNQHHLLRHLQSRYTRPRELSYEAKAVVGSACQGVSLAISASTEAMAEEDEVDKYKRLFDEQKAKVKELERQNSQLKVRCLCSL